MVLNKIEMMKRNWINSCEQSRTWLRIANSINLWCPAMF